MRISMQDRRAGKLHYARFAMRWKNLSELKKERVTLILSPHLDDVFLSLYATILSGKLGRNILGVNFFTASDSSVDAKASTTFRTVAGTSIRRMEEEMRFSKLLFSHGINYLPVFLGLKEASIGGYYKFIAGALMGKLSKNAGMRDVSLAVYSRMVSDYAQELDVFEALGPLLAQFSGSIKDVLAPIGIGTHIDHGVVAQSALKSVRGLKLGLYAEIPYVYMSNNMSLSKLRANVPRGFVKPMETGFDPEEKAKLFRKLYPSQYEERTREALFAVGKGLGEVILWKK